MERNRNVTNLLSEDEIERIIKEKLKRQKVQAKEMNSNDEPGSKLCFICRHDLSSPPSFQYNESDIETVPPSDSDTSSCSESDYSDDELVSKLLTYSLRSNQPTIEVLSPKPSVPLKRYNLPAYLKPYYFLREVVGYPLDLIEIEDELKTVGNPTDWFYFCESCSTLIDERSVLQRKINGFQQQQADLDERIREKVKFTLSCDYSPNASGNCSKFQSDVLNYIVGDLWSARYCENAYVNKSSANCETQTENSTHSVEIQTEVEREYSTHSVEIQTETDQSTDGHDDNREMMELEIIESVDLDPVHTSNEETSVQTSKGPPVESNRRKNLVSNECEIELMEGLESDNDSDVAPRIDYYGNGNVTLENQGTNHTSDNQRESDISNEQDSTVNEMIHSGFALSSNIHGNTSTSPPTPSSDCLSDRNSPGSEILEPESNDLSELMQDDADEVIDVSDDKNPGDENLAQMVPNCANVPTSTEISGDNEVTGQVCPGSSTVPSPCLPSTSTAENEEESLEVEVIEPADTKTGVTYNDSEVLEVLYESKEKDNWFSLDQLLDTGFQPFVPCYRSCAIQYPVTTDMIAKALYKSCAHRFKIYVEDFGEVDPNSDTVYRFECPISGQDPPRVFRRPEYLMAHMLKVHFGMYPWFCPLCSYRTMTANSFRLHLIQHYDEYGFLQLRLSRKYFMPLSRVPLPELTGDCKGLSEWLTVEQILNSGRRFLNMTVAFPVKGRCRDKAATACCTENVSVPDLYGTDPKGVFVCPFNDGKSARNYVREEFLKAHILAVHYLEIEPWQCDICRKTFTKVSSLRHHLFEKHQPFEALPCNHCSVRFGSIGALNNHVIYTHKPCTLVQCDLCPTMFDVQKDFIAHLPEKHPQFEFEKGDPTVRPSVVCEACPCEFKWWQDLRYHRLISHGRKDENSEYIECDSCPNNDELHTCHGTLTSHMEKHSPDSFKCEECLQLFKFGAQRDAHMRRHVGGVQWSWSSKPWEDEQ